MAELDRPNEGGHRFWMDGWDGYPNARRRLLESIAAHKPRNPVVVGGDRHAFFVADLKRDFGQAHEPVVASEFVGTSITSQGPSAASMQQALKGQSAAQIRPRRQARLCDGGAYLVTLHGRLRGGR